jgi:thiol-disulfide isomerase/thioredoxin
MPLREGRRKDFLCMPALNLDTDAAVIAAHLSQPDMALVACLCAQWCGTCRDYQIAFDQLADAHPESCFVWIDIETHADQLDEFDFDVENFPTILIEDPTARRFFGTVLPQARIVERMLSDLTMLPAAHGAPLLRKQLAGVATTPAQG